jgi:peroxiredoxin
MLSFRPGLRPPQGVETNRQDSDRLFADLGLLRVPRIAPPADISLPDLKGQEVTLSSLKGKIVFLNFWATWCSTCRTEMPSMEKLHIQFKDKDFVMVAIDLEEPAERVKSFINKYGLTFTTLLDSTGEIGDQFGIRALPTTYILDKEGAIIGKLFGPRKWGSRESFALFEHLISGDSFGSSQDAQQIMGASAEEIRKGN